jgi:hypothetical protein
MAGNFTGSCLCGAVRYECAADPVFTGNCHCRDCQKATGSAFVAALAVPAAALKIAGNVKYHDTKAENGNTFSRGFCPDCGSRLFGKSTGFPELAMITAGSLDDPSWYRAAMDFYVASAQPWDYMDPALPKFPTTGITRFARDQTNQKVRVNGAQACLSCTAARLY